MRTRLVLLMFEWNHLLREKSQMTYLSIKEEGEEAYRSFQEILRGQNFYNPFKKLKLRTFDTKGSYRTLKVLKSATEGL